MVANAAQIMEKALKTQEPAIFMGEEVLLTPIAYMEDLMLSGLLSEIEETAKVCGTLSDATVLNLRVTGSIIGTIKLCMHKKDGTPYYKTFDEAFQAAKPQETLSAMLKLYGVFNEALELTRAEKKS